MASHSERDLARATIAVTGADGFIGRYVVAALRDARATVHEVTGEQTDLRDPTQATAAVRGANHVVHLAARAGGVQFQSGGGAAVFADNTTMTRNVLEAAAAEGVQRVFLASSAVVYSRDAESPLTEDASTVAPEREMISGYAWSKLTDEVQARWLAEWSSLEVVVGRFTNVYGRGATFDPTRSTVVHALVKKAVDAAPGGSVVVWGDGSAVRSFIHVKDAARAVRSVLASGAAGSVYNISTKHSVAVRKLAERVRDAVDPSLKLMFEPSRPSGPEVRVLDVARLAALGFEPTTDLQSGLRDVVEAYAHEAAS